MPSSIRMRYDEEKIFQLEKFIASTLSPAIADSTESRLGFVNILFWLRNALPMPNNFWKARKSRLKCKNKNKSSRKGCWISYLLHFRFKLEFIGEIDLLLWIGWDIWKRASLQSLKLAIAGQKDAIWKPDSFSQWAIRTSEFQEIVFHKKSMLLWCVFLLNCKFLSQEQVCF